MPSGRWLALPAVVAVALAAASAVAALTPRASVTTPLPVQRLAFAGGSVAYVADAPEILRCARIGLWMPASGRRRHFDAREQCTELASTGQGVWDVSVATRRVAWVTYAGGNVREWSLWTATTTRRVPRQLRFVARPVEDPPPVVLGPGTPAGIPYAVDREVVYLGDDGRALFRATVGSPVRALAAGTGPDGLRVAALLADGTVVGLDARGRGVREDAPGAPVASVRVSALGLAVQRGRVVTLGRRTLRLPAGATMADVEHGRILWTRAGDLGTTAIASGRSARIADGSPARPILGQLEPGGVAWSRDRVVRWQPGAPG